MRVNRYIPILFFVFIFIKLFARGTGDVADDIQKSIETYIGEVYEIMPDVISAADAESLFLSKNICYGLRDNNIPDTVLSDAAESDYTLTAKGFLSIKRKFYDVVGKFIKFKITNVEFKDSIYDISVRKVYRVVVEAEYEHRKTKEVFILKNTVDGFKIVELNILYRFDKYDYVNNFNEP